MNTNKTASRVMQRAWAVLLAVALCLGLTPATAWAEEASQEQFSVALTIVDTTDPENGVLFNGEIEGMTSSETVADLLDKAGFSAVSDADATLGNDKTYFESWGSPTFRGNVSVQMPDGSYVYWATMFDGDSAGYEQAQLTANLQKNGHYQYIYTSDSTFSYDDEAASFPVQLTVVDTSVADGTVKNIKVDGMNAEKTVADLLETAGFIEGTQEESAADASGMTYFVSYNAPYFIGKSYDSQTGNFWATVFDGGVDPEGWSKAVLDAKLTPRGHYQYIYGTASTFEYSDSVPLLVGAAVNNPLPGNADDEDPVAPEKPEVPTYDPDDLNEADMRKLFTAIASSYSGTAEEWKALELAAIGRASDVDSATLLANAEAEAKNPSTTNLQRFVLAMTAVGLTEEASPLVELMATTSLPTDYINGQAFALLSYESGSYPVPTGALKSKDDLVAGVLAAQLPGGGWSWQGEEAGADMTAMMIVGLAPYAQDAAVKASIDKGLAALKGMQHDDGGFGATGTGVDPNTNANSTSAVVIALCALGMDPATSWATENGSTPMSALLSCATSDLIGFVYRGKLDDSATEQGFRALIAYQGLKNTSAAYNIYTQARLGQAGLPADGGKQEPKDEETTTPVKAIDKKTLAKTGDGTLPLTAGASALALSALAGAVIALRRTKNRSDSLLHR